MKNNSQIIVFAAEMPPLEPIHETESFHQAALRVDSEPVQTQAVDLGDDLKQVSGWINDLSCGFQGVILFLLSLFLLSLHCRGTTASKCFL